MQKKNFLKNQIMQKIKIKIYIYIWEAFYEFIVISYNTDYNNRFSISDLYFELKKRKISNHSKEMVKVYAHGMYILAKNNGKKIYDEFNA